MSAISTLFNSPSPVRAALRVLIRKANLGSYGFRYSIGALHRPNYAYLVYQAAQLAQRLGEKRVSVVEFGVAGGAGLIALEQHAAEVEKIFKVSIDIYGFDTGAGLPEPADYRDLCYHWKPGFFRMDQQALQLRLKRAKLVIGDIRDTIHTFAAQYNPAPIAAISQDLDFHSSTMAAFKLFDLDSQYLLPRMVVYFDDVIGGDMELYNDFTGQRGAIHEFNESHSSRKLSPLYYLGAKGITTPWHHQIWSFHAFDHPSYNRFIGEENQQLPIHAQHQDAPRS
jgi:hypothetical protein